MKICYEFANRTHLDALIELRILMQCDVHNISKSEVSPEYSSQLRNYFISALENEKYFSAIAVIDNQVIGTAGVCFYQKPPSVSGGTGLVGYVTNVFVLKKYRQTGIGQKLILKLNELAIQKNADKLHLGATSDGLNIYKKSGYSLPNFTNLEIKSPFEVSQQV